MKSIYITSWRKNYFGRIFFNKDWLIEEFKANIGLGCMISVQKMSSNGLTVRLLFTRKFIIDWLYIYYKNMGHYHFNAVILTSEEFCCDVSIVLHMIKEINQSCESRPSNASDGVFEFPKFNSIPTSTFSPVTPAILALSSLNWVNFPKNLFYIYCANLKSIEKV